MPAHVSSSKSEPLGQPTPSKHWENAHSYLLAYNRHCHYVVPPSELNYKIYIIDASFPRESAEQENTRMWANAQPDGRPAEHSWRPLFNAAKFG